MDSKKKTIILSILIVVTLILLAVGSTFAYFTASGNTSTSANVTVTTYTSDIITFEVGEDINIYTDQTTFGQGMNNASGQTYAKTTLVANNKTNTATKNYYLYLNIEDNDFEYTQNESTPELLLQVSEDGGNEVTSLNGLSYKTVTDGKGNQVSGFDITTKNGLITILDNRSITASPQKIEKWNVKIVFVNYDEDQNDNTGKSLSAKLLLQKESYAKLLSTWVIEEYQDQTSGSETIYLHNSSLTNGANDGSYRYAGANPNNYVCFGSDATTCPDDNLYRIIGVFDNKVKLIKWDYATTTLLGTNGGYNNTYQNVSSGDSGSSKGTNTQATIGAYNWNSTGRNTWSSSTLNTVNLNTNFLTNIGATWANKIAESTWKVGGTESSNVYSSPAATAYTNEYTNPVESTTESKKIGLMYTSDYGFAAPPSAWTTNLGYYNSSSITDANWMYMGLKEWAIVRMSGNAYSAFGVNDNGIVSYSYVNIVAIAVRPVFYLNSNVVKVGANTGSKTDPIRIN